MKKAKTFIIPMLALAAFGLVACGGGQSSSQQQSSSEPHASIDVDKIASVEITNKDAMKKDWPINEGSRTLGIKVLNTEGKQLSETVLIATGELKITTSNAQVADVLGAGVFAKAAGKATITVTCKGKSDTVEVNVVAPKVAQSVAATLQQIANLAQGETFPEAIMTKGVVKEITAAWDASYGNISFKIKDADADNELLCYRVVPAEGIDGSKIKPGDEVVINGKIKNYNGTLEYDAGAAIQEWKDGGQQVVTRTKINEVVAGDKVDLIGRVEAKSKRSAILNDGTGHIFIYGSADAIGAITVGKTYNVTGSTTEKNGAVQVESPVFTEKDPIDLAADTPTDLTAEIANGWKAAGAKFGSADVKLYSWIAKIGKAGSYLTYGVDGSTTNIQAGYTLDEYAALTEGKYYEIKAYFAGFSGGHATAAEDYANIVIIGAQAKEYAPESVVITGDQVVKEGELITLTATVSPARASQEVVWESSNPDAATVDENGNVTGVQKGTTTITATAKGTEIKFEYEITVNEGDYDPVESLSLQVKEKGEDQQPKTSGNIGDTLHIEQTVLPATASQFVTWESSDPLIASVDTKGAVTFKGYGDVTITATTVGKTTAEENVKKSIVLTSKGDANYASKTAAQFVEEVGKISGDKGTNKEAKYAISGKIISMDAKKSRILIADATGVVYPNSASFEEGYTPAIGDSVLVTGYTEKYFSCPEISGGKIYKSSAAVTPIAKNATIESQSVYQGTNWGASTALGGIIGSHVTITNTKFGASGNYHNLVSIAGKDIASSVYVEPDVELPADGVWGTAEAYVVQNNSSTKSLTLILHSFTPNEEGDPTDLLVSGEKVVGTGDNTQLTASFTNSAFKNPTASVEDIQWSSSDPAVATVDKGIVTGVAGGSVNITASYHKGEVNLEKVFAMTILPEGSEIVTASYSGSTTGNMTAEGNNAKSINLDENVFTVTSDKGEGNNQPGLNKAGYIALYCIKNSPTGNGASFTVTATGKTIDSIEINWKQKSNLAEVRVGGNKVTPTGNVYAINASSFTIINVNKANNTDQVQINNIQIIYHA